MEWLRTPLVDERAAAAAADAQAAQAQKPKKDGRHRLLQIDLLRGFIMAVMAWGQTTRPQRRARGGRRAIRADRGAVDRTAVVL